MSLIVYIAIMQIDLISSLMMLSGAGFFGYHGVKYARMWWSTPSDLPVAYVFWKQRRRQAVVAGAVLLIGMALPGRAEAVAQYAAWKVANASVWERIFSSGRTPLDEVIGRLVNTAN